MVNLLSIVKMGTPKIPKKVKLIAGLLFADQRVYMDARRVLERVFGKADFESAALDFSHTKYYEDEMGKNLKRVFLGFKRLVSLDGIYRTKLKTNALERQLSRQNKRHINIDPGYLDLSKVVLFSTKDYSHRVYLEDGIFAEVTLTYRLGRFNPWPWTYPDYQTEPYRAIFGAIRDIYKAEERRS